MQIKLLKDILMSIAGANAAGLVDLLYGKKNVNEFLIAKKLKLNINQTRNVLYKLADEGLVSFIRKKDKKNGGWYTYYWTLDITKSLVNLKNVILKDLAHLEEQVHTRQNGTFYHCLNCELEFDEEQSLLNNFTCPECGEVLVLMDNRELVAKLQSAITRRREQQAVVEAEISVLDHKTMQLRHRKIQAAARKKKAERAAKRKVRVRDLERAKKKSERMVKAKKRRRH